MVETKDGSIEGKRLPLYTFSAKKIIGMGKYEEGVQNAIQKAKKSTSECTWVKKLTKRLEGHEFYENDPISHVPKIGIGRQKALDKCGISTIQDYINHPERMEHLTSEKELIVRALKNGLENKIINCGICPDEFKQIDHRKFDNPYASKYGELWREKINKTPTMKLVSPISDMIIHMIRTTTDALKNTKYEGEALFYHDALSQLTEKTKEWMEKNFFEGKRISNM